MKGAPSTNDVFKSLIPQDGLTLPLLYVGYSEHREPGKIFEQLGKDKHKFELFKGYARQVLMVLGNDTEKLAQFKAYVQGLLEATKKQNRVQNYDPLPLSAFSEQEQALFFPIIDKLADQEIQPSDVFNLLNRDSAVLERFKVFFPSVGAARKQYQELLEKERQSEERLRGLQAEHERLQQNITYNYQRIAQARNEAATNISQHLRGLSTPTSSSNMHNGPGIPREKALLFRKLFGEWARHESDLTKIKDQLSAEDFKLFVPYAKEMREVVAAQQQKGKLQKQLSTLQQASNRCDENIENLKREKVQAQERYVGVMTGKIRINN